MEGAAKGFGGLGKIFLFVEDDAEVVRRFEIAGRNTQDVIVLGGGIGVQVKRLQRVREIEVVGRAVGLQIDRFAVMLDRRPRVALIQLSVAEIVVSVSVIGLKMEDIEEKFFGFRKIALIGERI